jgi:hypothetical protein
LSVTGTQQRVYGTLIYDNCHIDLRRFAIVFGSTTKSPAKSTTVTYGDAVPMTQTGYKYSGYITLFMYQELGDVYAAIEVRICKRDRKTILIETYGEVALPDHDIGLWFNKNNIKYFNSQYDFPQSGSETVTYIDLSTNTSYTWNGSSYTEGDGWIQLDSEIIGNTLSHNEQTITKFEEKGDKNSLTLMNCCKYCPDKCVDHCKVQIATSSCRLTSCVIGLERIKLNMEYLYGDYWTADVITIPYGLKYDGYETYYYSYYGICIEYKIGFDDGFYLEYWVYTLTNQSTLMYVEFAVRLMGIGSVVNSPYPVKSIFVSGFVSDFHEDGEITPPVIIDGSVSRYPVIESFDTLIGKTIHTFSGIPEHAKILDIDENGIAYIDPETIESEGPHEFKPRIDGDFEISTNSARRTCEVKILDWDIPLGDLCIDLTMTVTFFTSAPHIPTTMSAQYPPCIFPMGGNWIYDSEPMPDFIRNPDGTFTIHREGPLTQKQLKYYSSDAGVGIHFRIDQDLYCSALLSGNIRWYTSTGREMHYGDKGLLVSNENCAYYNRLQMSIETET